jgi:hypothetical protein
VSSPRFRRSLASLVVSSGFLNTNSSLIRIGMVTLFVYKK